MIDSTQQALESIYIVGWPSPSGDNTRLFHPPGDGGGDFGYCLVEHIQQVLERTSNFLTPHHRTRLGLGKRQANPDGLSNLSDLSVQYVSNAKRRADTHWIRVRIRLGEAGATGGDRESPETAQFNDQLLG